MKREAKLLPAQATSLTARGLARLNIESHPRKGLELFGPLAQEEVLVQLGRRHNVWLQQVVQPHSARREARCLHFGPCGGCNLQHMHETSQLAWKNQRIAQMLGQEVELLPPLASPQSFHYRTKVEFSFVGDNFGFHRRGCFDRAVAVERCWIAPPIHHVLVQATRQWQHDHGLRGWNARLREGDLRYLLVRQANHLDLTGSQWLTVLVTRADLSRELVEDWAARQPDGGGILWVGQSSTAGAIVADFQVLLRGSERIEQRLGDLRFSLGWRSFFQSNPPAYQRLLDQLRQWLGEPRSLLDLYCGIGSIGLYVAPAACRLVGVESVVPAVEDARRCAAEFGRQAEFHVCASEDWEDWQGFESVILDPPRSGCHPRLLQRLIEHGPGDVFYISCNPERFVAELRQLSSVYRIKKAVVCDFFPQTSHVELLAWLRRL